MSFFKNHQSFVNFLIVLLSGVFWKATRWEWQHPFLYFIYPVAAGAAWFFLFWGLARFLKRQFIQRQFKTFVISLLCLPVLLLPFTRWYETTRFWLLKNQMEAVAVQYAEEYKEEIAEKGYVSAYLPLDKLYLSRVNGKIVCFDECGSIKAAFNSCLPIVETSWEFIYNTELSSEYPHSYPFPKSNGIFIKLNEKWEYRGNPIKKDSVELGG